MSGMNESRIYNIILAPLNTEKTANMQANNNQIGFRVLPSATKPEIKAAIEHLFGVNVLAVRTANVKALKKRFGRTMGTEKAWKKAYVTLEQGKSIDFTSLN